MDTKHPKWAIKYIHKSKINAVHIVNWEDHHHIATVPHVYTHNGEKSEGAQAAELMVAAHELLQFVVDVEDYLMNDSSEFTEAGLKRWLFRAQNLIAKATP